MTSISKSLYIDRLDDIVVKYNNTNHSTIKMKPVARKKIMEKILNLQIVILLEYKNLKTVL